MANIFIPSLFHRILIAALFIGNGLLGIASAADLSARREGFERALSAAESEPLANFSRISKPYANHPLAPYLDYVALRRQLDHLEADTAAEFLAKHGELPFANSFRVEILNALAKRKDWAGFRQLYVGSTDAGLRCADLMSRQATIDSAWLEDALSLWLTGKSQPAQCDGVFTTLKDRGQLTLQRHLDRALLGAKEHNLGLIRFLARQLPAAESARLQSYAGFLEAPSAAPMATWPTDAFSRDIALLGIKRLAQKDATAAEALLASAQAHLNFDAKQRGDALNQIALWTAASYYPESVERFAKVPAEAWDARLHEWQAREALARKDDSAARAAIARMPEAQRNELRWRYFDARLAERAGDASAQQRFAELATEPSYYGFLAADRIGAPYTLCPREVNMDDAAKKRVKAHPGFIRAMELFALNRVPWARREWDAFKSQLSPEERAIAVTLAHDVEWYDRGAFTLNAGDDLRYYELRFPLPHQRKILRDTQTHGLDPAWVSALIRAESAWLPDARSHANARGLMQLLPSTAQQEAKLRGWPYPGDQKLYDPNENLTLGIAHLATMLTKHNGMPFLATAAYNAGPTPVARWLSQRSIEDVDLWIETITYRETREYVSRILAFAVIYDWRFGHKALSVSDRALGKLTPNKERHRFVCNTPTQGTPQ